MSTVAKTGRAMQMLGKLFHCAAAPCCFTIDLDPREEARARGGRPRLANSVSTATVRVVRIDHAADLVDAALERLAGIGIDRGAHRLPGVQIGQVALRQPEAQLDRRGLDDHERHRGVAQALADVGLPLGDDAGDRRHEHGVGKMLARQVARRLGGEDGRLSGLERRFASGHRPPWPPTPWRTAPACA